MSCRRVGVLKCLQCYIEKVSGRSWTAGNPYVPVGRQSEVDLDLHVIGGRNDGMQRKGGKHKWQNLHVAIRMKLFGAYIPFRCSSQPVHIRFRPVVDPGKWSQRKSFQTLRETEIIPPPNILQVRVCWPWIQRDPDNLFLYLDEPCLFQHLPCPSIVSQRPRSACCCVQEVVHPLYEM